MKSNIGKMKVSSKAVEEIGHFTKCCRLLKLDILTIIMTIRMIYFVLPRRVHILRLRFKECPIFITLYSQRFDISFYGSNGTGL